MEGLGPALPYVAQALVIVGTSAGAWFTARLARRGQAKEIASLQKKHKELGDKYAVLERENERLSRELTRVTALCEKHERRIETLEEEGDRKDNRIGRLLDENMRLKEKRGGP